MAGDMPVVPGRNGGTIVAPFTSEHQPQHRGAGAVQKLMRLVRDHWDDGVALLAILDAALVDPSPVVRLKAVEMIFERGWGRPSEAKDEPEGAAARQQSLNLTINVNAEDLPRLERFIAKHQSEHSVVVVHPARPDASASGVSESPMP